MFSWSEFSHNLLSDLIAKRSSEVFYVQPLVRLSCFEEAHFFSSQTKTRCLPIISTPAHWRSFMLHNFGSWFARIEPTTFFSVAKSPSLHFLLATPLSPTLSAFFPSFLILTFLPKACRRPPSLSLTLHPACLFTFSALFFFLFSHLQFPFYLSFLATVSHTPPRAFTLSTYIYIFSFLLSVLPVLSVLKSSLVFFDSFTSPHPLCRCWIPNMHWIPVVSIWLLSTLPPSQVDRPLWHCPLVYHLPLWRRYVRESLWQSVCLHVCERKQASHPLQTCILCVSLCCLTCLSLTSPSVSVSVSLLYSVGATHSQTRGLELDLGCLSSILRSPEGEAC